MQRPLLILTIGTGIGDRVLDLAEGLRTTIRLIDPQAYWLVPSASPDSIALADLVREGVPGFQPYSSENGSTPYLAVTNPDDLESCRLTLRQIILRAQARLRGTQSLLVNPTSGTKQMSAAATLAALDAEVGNIIFTVGKRQGGLVVAGHERLMPFNPLTFFAERDLRLAVDLAQRGDWSGAARILERHRASHARALAAAQCLHAWSRLDYTTAASAAARIDEGMRRHLSNLALAADENRATPELVADVLCWADDAQRRGDAERALSLGYKTLELAARLCLSRFVPGPPPHPLHRLIALPLDADTRRRLEANARDGTVYIGLWTTCKILKEIGDAFGASFFEDPRLVQATRRRNEHVHSIRPVAISEAQQLLDLTRNLLSKHLDLPAPVPRPALAP